MPKQRVTLKEVASSAGVSYQTVSKVINHQVHISKETEARIWQAVRDLGYHPNYTARSLRSRRSFTIGYSWPPTPPDHANPILDQFLQSMFMAAEERGYYLLCFPYHDDPVKMLATYSELVNTSRVDGFILSSVEYDDPRILLLQESNSPFVAFGRSNPEMVFPWIDVDGGQGIYLAVKHLLAAGHSKIAALAWPKESRVGNNRMEGYFNALEHAGISPESEWIKRGQGNFSFGFQAMQELLDLPKTTRPTALITLNDPMAIGALQAAKERGLQIGGEFAIAGFDDSPMVQYLDPPLTSVRQPVWEVGQRIIPMLLEYIEHGYPPEPPCVLINPQLIVRSSTSSKHNGAI